MKKCGKFPRFGIFAKTFVYTTVFLIIVVGVAFAMFYQQITAFYATQQLQRLQRDYSLLYEQFLTADRLEMLDTARQFADVNRTFVFRIMDSEQNTVFSTFEQDNFQNFRVLFVNMGGYTLAAQDSLPQTESNLLNTVILTVFLVIVIALASTAIFAKQMTFPIKNLVKDTKKMVQLLPIKPPPPRNDEIGDLSQDVHNMYNKLKSTIIMLENENQRRREMEESQNYFFSAASHELKTPIAATSLLLEGMLANIGDYSNHPKYLQECIRLMDTQTSIIYEILDIVKLNEKYNPQPTKIDINRLVSEEIAKHDIQAEISVKISENLFCRTDLFLLKKAFSNIFMNAVQNTPPTGKIEIFSQVGAAKIRLSVRNTGEISEEHLAHIFEPFYMVDKARSRRQNKMGKTGLGLTIVKKSLDILGVRFGLENTAEGCLFWVDLPVMP
ncbi:MAG: HAMP domain-containing histidine kinase [Defluviitaleaceae bacterium]|nr:HAMP domain-containing histidine kinase [Defluviitaleaceae bacterium]